MTPADETEPAVIEPAVTDDAVTVPAARSADDVIVEAVSGPVVIPVLVNCTVNKLLLVMPLAM